MVERPDSPSLTFSFGDETVASSNTEDEPSASEPKPKPKLKRTLLKGSTLACKPLPKTANELRFGDFLETCIASVGGACFAYEAKGSPLAGKGEKLRGEIAQAAAVRLFALQGREVAPPPSGEKCVNGSKRGESSASYDVGLVERGNVIKVEVKNARMTHDPSMERWKLLFCNVKKDAHDRLVLCFEGYNALHFYLWDGETGYCTNGKSEGATGGCVAVRASRSQPSFDDSHDQLLAKMGAAFESIGKVRLDDPDYADIFSMSTKRADVYEDAPLAALSGKARGTALEVLTRSVLEHLGEEVEDADGGLDCSGKRLPKCQTTSDFKVGGERGEAKSSLMIWNRVDRRFELHFACVKSRLHDRLFLSFMTPECVHIFEYKGERGNSTTGVSTDATGNAIKFYGAGGKHGSHTWRAAEKDILRKIHFYNDQKSGGRYVARVSFADGDAAKVMRLGAQKGSFFDTAESE